jgi:hypothetical protein
MRFEKAKSVQGIHSITVKKYIDFFGIKEHEMDFVCLKILPEKAAYFFRILTQNISLSNQIVVWIDPLKLGFNFCDAYKNGQQFISCNTNTGKEEFLSKET